MNINLSYPLEHFLIWTTGNNHEVSVQVDEVIAEAIKQADPTETLAHIDEPKPTQYIVYWADYWLEKQLRGLTLMQLYEKLSNYMASNDLVKANIVQQILKEKV